MVALYCLRVGGPSLYLFKRIAMSVRMNRKNGRTAPAPRKRNGRKGQKNAPRGGGALAANPQLMIGTRTFEPWMPIFPATTVRKLRYSTSVALVATSGVVVSQVFRANDLFDPDFTGTGHQPMGFDQLMLWYNHFTVMEATITVSFKNTLTVPGTCSLRVDGDSTALTVIDRILELGGCVFDTLGGFGDTTKKLVLRADIGKLQGVNRSALTADVSLQGSSSASPVECTYFHVQYWNSSGVTSSCYADILIEYTAHFCEPRNLTPSKSITCDEKESVMCHLTHTDEQKAGKAAIDADCVVV